MRGPGDNIGTLLKKERNSIGKSKYVQTLETSIIYSVTETIAIF